MRINLGSGQRRFEGWVNVDSVSRPGQVPDVLCDGRELTTHFEAGTADVIALHHVLEHFGCGEADEVVLQCWEVLRPGGSLLVFVPDLHNLAREWLNGVIGDYTFLVNVYGAYQGEEGDRHRWGYSHPGLVKYLIELVPWDRVEVFDYRAMEGADFASDWWIAAVECVK